MTQTTNAPPAAQERADQLKNRFLIAASVAFQVSGNALLSSGLHHHHTSLSSSFLHYVYAIANPSAIIGVVLLSCWMICNLSLLSRVDLSYVLPITGSLSFILIALVGHFFLGEKISWVHWLAICLISLGVLIVLETAPLTVAVHEAPEDEQ